jgi:FkbM family methyltransferase
MTIVKKAKRNKSEIPATADSTGKTKPLKETTETRYHKKFTYYTNDSIIGRSLRMYGEYGQSEIDFLLDVLNNITNKPKVIYDVGANIGVHATAFASAKGSHVHCFEPNPLNYNMLKLNTKGLDNVTLHKAAATNVAGDILIQTFDPEVPGNYGEVLINKESGVSAKAVRLDDVDIPAPNLIKIDAEGSELGVIQGCLAKIKKNLPLVYYEAQESPHLDKIYDILTDIGYHLYWGCIRNYNAGNFKNNTDNIFGTTALFSVIAVPPGWAKVEGLEPVKDAQDSWKRFITPTAE